MTALVIEEATSIAAARWLATETRASRRARQAAALLAEVEQLLSARWLATEPVRSTPAPDLATAGRWWAPADPPATYRLFDRQGQAIRCHLCAHDDRWRPEGDAEQQVVRLFVCEHAPLRIGHGLVRQVSTVAISRVMRCEAVGSRQ